MTLRAVIFDADGVLLDSLSSHLALCADKSREYGLSLEIPDAAELKRKVRAGVAISPMVRFFSAVGFPDALAEAADRDYQETFMQRYAPRPFRGVGPMLHALRVHGLRLGIVTSNVRANVVQALGPDVANFEDNGIFAFDTVPNFSKPLALRLATTALGVAPGDAVYVGDQRSDWEAAQASGVSFLGVAYGWGISEDDRDFPVASALDDIPSKLGEFAARASR